MLEVAQRIKELRVIKGLSQDELALKMGYRTRSSINKIEKGLNILPLKKLEKMAKILGTTTEYLLNGHQSNNLLDHFNAISDYIDNYPYHLLYFPRDYKLELYNKLKELDTENWLPKDFSIYSSAEMFWTAINYLDLPYDEEKLIDIRQNPYYVDTTVLTDTEILELEAITTMVISLFQKYAIKDCDKDSIRKYIGDLYIKLTNK